MVMAQNPASCEFDSMPRSAFATGLVDYELPPAEMPAQPDGLRGHAFGKPPHNGQPGAAADRERAEEDFRPAARPDRARLFTVQAHHHPPPHRAAHGGAPGQTLDAYVQYLQQTPAEVEALFRDILIGVTNFFRDPEAFAALERTAIPQAL
jgi:two-component system CheB/CheR fusion protein